MNSLAAEQVFMRSLATRRQHLATSAVLADVLTCCGMRTSTSSSSRRPASARATRRSSTSSTCDVRDDQRIRRGEPAREDRHARLRRPGRAQQVREARRPKTLCATCASSGAAIRVEFKRPDDQVPVFPTIASRFNDPGVNRLFARSARGSTRRRAVTGAGQSRTRAQPNWSSAMRWCRRRVRATWPRSRRTAAAPTKRSKHRSDAASRAQSLYEALRTLGDAQSPEALERYGAAALADGSADSALLRLRAAYNDALEAVGTDGLALLRQWPAMAKSATDDQFTYTVRARKSVRQLCADAEPQSRAQARGAAFP